MSLGLIHESTFFHFFLVDSRDFFHSLGSRKIFDWSRCLFIAMSYVYYTLGNVPRRDYVNGLFLSINSSG